MTEGAHTATKPLFIPLMGIYYDAFARGEKSYEYRPYGPRWNERTCFAGRKAILSRGYGKKNRMTRTVGEVRIVPPGADFIKIYGEGKRCLAIQLV
jgi:hypothetical protein